MSDLLTTKATKFDLLNDRERKILDEIMANPSVKIREVCDRLGEPEQTVRGALTSLYKKLDIPETERDKRGFLVREYQEAYQERYLRVGEIPSDTPVITVSPQKAELSRKELVQLTIFFAVVAGIELIVIIALAIERSNLLQQIR